MLFVFQPKKDARGSDWIIIDGPPGRDDGHYYFYFIDKGNIRRPSKSIFRYSGMTVSVPKEGPLPADDDLKNKYNPEDYIELDCNEKKTRSIKSEKELPGYEESKFWFHIEPDSINEKIYKLLCDKEK